MGAVPQTLYLVNLKLIFLKDQQVLQQIRYAACITFFKAILVMRLKGFQGGLSVRVFLDSKLDGRICIT